MLRLLLVLALVSPAAAKQFAPDSIPRTIKPAVPLQRFTAVDPCLETDEPRKQATWVIRNKRTGEIVKRSDDGERC